MTSPGKEKGKRMGSLGPLRARSERGAAAVEFGLIAIILLTLLIGIVQFSLWFWAYQVGSHAAREGARVGAVDPCDAAAAEARAVDRVGAAGTPGTIDVDMTTSATPVHVGDSVVVNVTFEPRTIGGLFTLPDIDKTAEARVENVPAGGC